MQLESSRNPETPDEAPLIDGFEMIDKCGQGSASSLWKARQISLGRTVVIKVLSEHLSHDPEDIKQFQFEASVAANLKHQGIVQVFDFGQARQGGRHYFVMEYITGYSVGNWLRRKGKLSEPDSFVIAHCVAEALGYAWEHARIIHCDIKPDNIMIDGDGTVKVTDLGLARVVRSFGVHPGDDDETVMGTPNYMSPEQALGQKHLDYRSDIYSMGATLYHLLTGILPFGDSENTEVLKRQVKEDLEYPQKVAPELSIAAAELIVKMMAKNPAHRHQSWSEVVKDIVQVQHATRDTGSQYELPDKIDVSGQTIPIQELSAADTISCPHCARLMGKGTSACPSCGKPVRDKNDTSEPTKKRAKLRIKSSEPPTPAQIIVPVAEMPRRQRRRRSHVGANLRVVASLALIIFLGYYGYQKLVNNRDILLPLRIRIYRDMLPACRQALEKSKTFVRDLLPAWPESPEDAGGETDGGMETPAGQDAVEVERVRNAEARNPEFVEILRDCERQCPKVGDSINVKLKKQDNAVEGAIERIGPDGVDIRVDKGTIMCPFIVMEDEARLLFCPQERARMLFQQRHAE